MGFRKEERGRAWASSEGINRVRKEEKEVQARIHTHKDRHMHVQAHTHARIRTVGHIFPRLSSSQGHRRSVAAKASCRGQPLQDGGIFQSRRRRGGKDRPVGRPHGGGAVAGVGGGGRRPHGPQGDPAPLGPDLRRSAPSPAVAGVETPAEVLTEADAEAHARATSEDG